MWQADSDLVDCASDILADESSSAFDQLIAIGTLCASGAGMRNISMPMNMWSSIATAMHTMTLDCLNDATETLRHVRLCISMGAAPLDYEIAIVDALRARDNAELVRIGAESIGLGYAYSHAAKEACVAFDITFAELKLMIKQLDRTLSTEGAWIAPVWRERFPWHMSLRKYAAWARRDAEKDCIV